MTCGKTITINISAVTPGEGENWKTNNPRVDWGDGKIDTGVSGDSLSHTYTAVGEYTIVLSGENTCSETCYHEEDVLTIENPTGISSSQITVNSAHVSWNAVPGSTDFKWELYSSGNLVGSGFTSNVTYVDLSGLTPATTYVIYVDTMVGANESSAVCGDAIRQFTTGCSVPTCDFVVS